MLLLVTNLMRDARDKRYWSGIFGMTGAACLAVAFIQLSALAFCVGCIFSLFGLRFNRR